MADKRYALDLNYEEWKEYLEKGLEEPKFRADQICRWLWRDHAESPEEMTNLSKPLREKLAERMDFSFPALAREERSADGTRKFLWRLRDGETVESVLMKQGDRRTACISTQVGCPLQCAFCATGLSGFVRNLSAGEIAGQVAAIEKAAGREVNNVVYMGMGEPFLNTEAVLKSIRMLNDPKMRSLGIRHITVSTSGVIPGIMALAASGLGVRLAVSLHAADDELRGMLMPVNHSYPTAELRRAMQEYQEATGDRITIEYALLGGVNDGVERARELVRYLKGIHVFINLIPFNAVGGRYERPGAEAVLRFKSVLQTAGFECEIRAEQGADINAACGQLRRKSADGMEAPLESPAFSPADFEAAEKKSAPQRSEAPRAGGARAKAPSRTSGGFVAERGKRRRVEAEPRERYRGGKLKEARPAYKGKRNEGDGLKAREGGRKEARPLRDDFKSGAPREKEAGKSGGKYGGFAKKEGARGAKGGKKSPAAGAFLGKFRGGAKKTKRDAKKS
ncbi:MAG: 23S rRNA (adenine(2503)-C(2))-methyltransferase RlmN [Synergistaceae bacterium]|nr:23S rRNA (adenine(2503)-C(2))-methyltransferase RlmN [Synergistaceae bacterium]